MFSLDEFKLETNCVYKDEQYSVRDNGAVLRHSRENKPKRKYDNQWTFGTPNSNNYLLIASEVVHRIVAYAFLGEPPTKQHIVDHIDTNRQNNRPENLRWLTKLENILNNPITVKRIIFRCGSIEIFLKDPSILKKYENEDPNFSWMRTVTPEEAQISWERLNNWAKKEIAKPLIKGSFSGEWIFNRDINETPPYTRPNYIMSKTPNAAQRIIFTPEDKPNEYPSTPQEFEGNPLTTYYERLTEGSVFFRNHNGEYVVVKSGFSKDRHSLYVLTKAAYVYREQEGGEWTPVTIADLSERISDNDLPHSLAEITFEDGFFVHGKVESGFHPTGELKDLFDEYIQEL